ncbi:alpha/beta hydrolase [Spirosoma rhododendri]|uniref:Alpha/beta hydrolase n=2 Tax=Spirosoma rhododendri TaxID=2728024 RepID=A0A7L5DVH6_9BACT|nr:alpha/beta hydrolase [Spirosoma rhododendri]
MLAACQPGDVKPDPVLIHQSLVTTYTNKVLHSLESPNDSLVYTPGSFSLSIQRLTYQTTLEDGTPITASGIVYLPVSSGGAQLFPILGYQHPTAFSNAEVPSGYDYTQPDFSYPLYFATHGYIVACPDYVGYGDASSVAHPYENRASLAHATADMLRATNEWLQQQATPSWNGQVFLAGFSEGGYATLSAQQLIEQQYADQLPLTGTSCGSGPYAMASFFDYITHQTTSSPGVVNYLYVWQTVVYNKLYNGSKPLSYYFKSPYAEQLAVSLDNARSFTVSFDKICTDQFRADVRNPASTFGKALLDNDLTSRAVRSRTYLIHGDQDEVIPYFISQQTCSLMQQQGASQISLVTLKNQKHVPSEVLFMRRSLELFEALKK